eukprot:15447399-Alexandrium_andersonii.AAC.1
MESSAEPWRALETPEGAGEPPRSLRSSGEPRVLRSAIRAILAHWRAGALVVGQSYEPLEPE